MSFSLNRFLNLLRIELYQTKGGLKVFVGVLFGSWTFLFLLFHILPSIVIGDKFEAINHIRYCGFALLFSMIWVASISLSSFHRLNQFPVALSIPGSSFEYFLKAWVISFIVTPLLVILLYAVFAFSIMPLLCLIPGLKIDYSWFNIMDDIPWRAVSVLLFINAIFMLGSISFRHYALLKTVIVFISTFIGFLIILVVVMGYTLMTGLQRTSSGISLQNLNLDTDLNLVYVVAVFTFLFYVVSFLKIKEKQG